MTSQAALKHINGPVSILITGANQGIGFHTAEILVAHQDSMTLYVGARSMEKAKGAVEKLQEKTRQGVKLVPLVVDVNSDKSIEDAAKSIDHLDILVNNAGIAFPDDRSSSAVLREQMRSIYETNVFGATAMIIAFLPALRKAKEANPARIPAIVNVSSEVGSIGGVADGHPAVPKLDFIAYPSSKAALNFVTAWGKVHLPDIRVSSCTPGYCATNLNRYSGPKTPQAGAHLIAEAILDHDGQSGRYYGEDGQDLPW